MTTAPDLRVLSLGGGARGNVAFAGTMFLHGSTIPLRDADLRSSVELAADRGQDPLFDDDAVGSDCAAGVCFT